jgi:hypothetical protein
VFASAGIAPGGKLELLPAFLKIVPPLGQKKP